MPRGFLKGRVPFHPDVRLSGSGIGQEMTFCHLSHLVHAALTQQPYLMNAVSHFYPSMSQVQSVPGQFSI